MHRGDDNHGEGALVDGKLGLAEEWGCKVAAELVECHVHNGLVPNVCTEDIGEEPLNGSDEALSIG